MENLPPLPDFLNRKLNPRVYTPEEEHVIRTWRVRDRNGIVWPRKKIERALKIKARLERRARKDKAKIRSRKEKEWNG